MCHPSTLDDKLYIHFNNYVDVYIIMCGYILETHRRLITLGNRYVIQCGTVYPTYYIEKAPLQANIRTSYIKTETMS